MSSRSTTFFDRLPTEIILHIFNYLSNNDIIYGFFNLNQRLNNILLDNQHYLKHLELPKTNFKQWKNIFSIIGFQIKCLNIDAVNLLFPMKYFPHLKSIIIHSSLNLSDEELKLIFENQYFNNLYSLKIKQKNIPLDELCYDDLRNSDYIFKQIFNGINSLKTLEYPYRIPTFSLIDINTFENNLNLNSLTLTLTEFGNIFVIISNTPNLTYLNIQSDPPYRYVTLISQTDIKLKRLHLKLVHNQLRHNDLHNNPIAIDILIDAIKLFSSSLVYLSLDLIHMPIKDENDFPFNNLILQQLLESMLELNQFHLYARLDNDKIDNDLILSRFKNSYWFDHNLSFAMHRNYFYTLPFQFSYLYNFYQDFNHVISNNPPILGTNTRLWHNVKSIDLPETFEYVLNFINELQIKIPKLTFIKFNSYDNGATGRPDFHTNKDQFNNISIRFSNVRTLQCTGESLENIKEWIIYLLPNLTHLILFYTKLPSLHSELTQTLNNKIQRLNLNTCSQLEQLTEISYEYFSNVQSIEFCLDNMWSESKWYADIIMKILKKFKNLNTLFMYIHAVNDTSISIPMWTELTDVTGYLDMKEVMKNFQVRYFRESLLFSKKIYEHDNIHNGVLSSILRKFSLFHRTN